MHLFYSLLPPQEKCLSDVHEYYYFVNEGLISYCTRLCMTRRKKPAVSYARKYYETDKIKCYNYWDKTEKFMIHKTNK